MAAEERDTSQTAVKTYVPTSQRETWDEHAAELDMSRSEFVRSMVQAGRRGFDPRSQGPETGVGSETDSGESLGPPNTAGDPADDADGGSFDELVLELLDEECLSWDELFEALTDDVGARLDEALDRLQEENEVKHSGREGGYVRLE